MSQRGARYLSGAAAGAALTAIVVWVVDQLRRDSDNLERDRARRAGNR
jgi:hypothetical protein